MLLWMLSYPHTIGELLISFIVITCMNNDEPRFSTSSCTLVDHTMLSSHHEPKSRQIILGIMVLPENETINYQSSYVNIEAFGCTYLRIYPRI